MMSRICSLHICHTSKDLLNVFEVVGHGLSGNCVVHGLERFVVDVHISDEHVGCSGRLNCCSGGYHIDHTDTRYCFGMYDN
jgi:hypothetical protein